MKISFKLFTSIPETKQGYPIKLIVSHQGTVKRTNINLYSTKENWDFSKQMPINTSTDFALIYPKLLNYRAIARKLVSDDVSDFETIKGEILGFKRVNVGFKEFTDLLVAEKRVRGSYAYADLMDVIARMVDAFAPGIKLEKINYNWLMSFRREKENNNLSTASVHNYLRTMRTIYNEAVQRGLIKDTRPFEKVLHGLTVRSNRTQKKYIDIEGVHKLETAKLSKMMAISRDLWLLQFYFGGQDLIDIYNLKKTDLHNGRVFFNRAKLAGKGYEFDLSIPEKAQKIINSYPNTTDFVFEFSKDFDYYKQFRRRYRRSLKSVQNLLNIEIQPRGGNLAVKVARHTFANRGKRLFMDEDLLRELMGHERADIDNYYKDKYPQDVRDAAQLKIISK